MFMQQELAPETQRMPQAIGKTTLWGRPRESFQISPLRSCLSYFRSKNTTYGAFKSGNETYPPKPDTNGTVWECVDLSQLSLSEGTASLGSRSGLWFDTNRSVTIRPRITGARRGVLRANYMEPSSAIEASSGCDMQ